MTFDDFKAKYNGVGVDTDGAYGFQCMDLMHKYCQDVLGLSDLRILAAPNAKSVYTNFSNVFGHEKFEKIDNTPTGVPVKGDIVFWGTGDNGHVAIFDEGDMNTFRSFDQNFPTNSKCHIQSHSYTGVLGWLRFKQPPQPQQSTSGTISSMDKNLVIEEIYTGILGVKANADENNSRQKQLNLGVPLHDIVSQVLNEDERSPLVKIKNTQFSLSSFSSTDLLQELLKRQ